MTDRKISSHTIRRLRTSYITTIVSITLVLFMLSIIGLLLLNARTLSNYVKENIGFSVIISDNVKDADKVWLQKELVVARYAKSAKLVTKEQAAEDLKQQLGEDFVGFLGYNPLLASIDVMLHADYANKDSIEVIKKELLKHEQVKEVLYQENLVHVVSKNANRISIVIAIFSIFLLLISTALINNTIRLSVYANRFSIKTMQLVGATDAFIRKPFLMKSLIYGIIGAAMALSMVYVAVFYLHKQFENVIAISNIGGLTFIIIAIGISMSCTSTYLAVNKYLRLNIDQLYF